MISVDCYFYEALFDSALFLFYQVKHSTLRESIKVLHREEGKLWLLKGWSARLVHSVLFSLLVIPVYEGIKIASLDDKYKRHVS